MWPETDTKSYTLTERAGHVFAGGSTRLLAGMAPRPVYINQGQATYIHGVAGNAIFDLTNNFASLIHRHDRPEMVAAVTERVARGTCFTLPTPTDVKLAEFLLGRLTDADRLRFLNSGTETVMMALHAARAHSGQPVNAKVEGAHHGMYDRGGAARACRPNGRRVGRPGAGLLRRDPSDAGIRRRAAPGLRHAGRGADLRRGGVAPSRVPGRRASMAETCGRSTTIARTPGGSSAPADDSTSARPAAARRLSGAVWREVHLYRYDKERSRPLR